PRPPRDRGRPPGRQSGVRRAAVHRTRGPAGAGGDAGRPDARCQPPHHRAGGRRRWPSMKPLLVVDAPKRFPLKIPGTDLVSAFDYLSDPTHAGGPGRKVFNLCRSLKYQSEGYYVSLLAEARGHRPLPSVAAIRDLKLGPVVR